MGKRSSRSERKLCDENADSKPPAVQRSRIPEENEAVPLSPPPADDFRRPIQTPAAAGFIPRTRSATTRSSRSSSSRDRSRLALEELDDEDNDRPVKPPLRKLSTHPESSFALRVARSSPANQSSTTQPFPSSLETTQNAAGLSSRLETQLVKLPKISNKDEEADTRNDPWQSISSRPSLALSEGEVSMQSNTDSNVDEATACTLDFVLEERYAMGEKAPVAGKSTTQPQFPMSSRRGKMLNIEIEAEEDLLLDDSAAGILLSEKEQKQRPSWSSEDKGLSGQKLERPNGNHQTFVDNPSRTDSLSTVPDPPSLHQGDHYIQPGAFRVTSGGVPRSTDADSLISSTTSQVTSRTHQGPQLPFIEASLVEDDIKDNEFPSAPAPANYAASIAEFTQMTLATTATASPIVEAHPLDESRTIQAFFRSRKVIFVICLMTFTFVVLVLGTIYGVTGFENVMGASAPESNAQEPTNAPSDPGDLNLEYFVHVALPEYSRQALRRENSPQSKALAWLRNNTLLETYSLSRRLERFSLATFFFSTGGDRRWRSNSSWLSDDDECSWYSGNNESSVCGSEGYKELILGDNDLRGTLPLEVALLSSLEVLEMPRNILSGFLPTTLGDMSNLREMQLLDNYLSGTIPSQIGQLTGLEVFDLRKFITLRFLYLAQSLFAS
jgi:hypothetical protein